MEKRHFAEINASFDQAQKQTLAASQPLINELVRAGYVAKPPGATPQQRDGYATLRAKHDPIMARSTGYLIAVQILLHSIWARYHEPNVRRQMNSFLHVRVWNMGDSATDPPRLIDKWNFSRSRERHYAVHRH